MSQTAVLTAVLEMQRGQFRTEREKTTQELGQMRQDFAQAGAGVAVLERALASDKGNQALQQQCRDARKELGQLEREMKSVESQKKRLDAALASSEPVAAPAPPDESKRYQDYLRRGATPAQPRLSILDEQDSRKAMPRASRPEAQITGTRRTSKLEQESMEGGMAHGGGGNASMRNAELMHSGRAFASEMAAGVSPLQAFMAEAPRLFQAFASSLGALLAPIAALAGGAMFVKWLHDAKEEARALREETARIGSNLGSLSGADAGKLEQSLKAAAEHVQKVREANGSVKNGFLHNLHDTDVQDAEATHKRIQDRMQDAQGRDQNFERRSFEGDDKVEADKIQLQYAQERDEIVRKMGTGELADGTRALELAQQKRDLALEELEVRKQAKKNEIDEEAQVAGSHRRGDHVESMVAQDHLDRIRADMANGPHNEEDMRRLRVKEGEAVNTRDEAQHREREQDLDTNTRRRNADLRGSSDDVAFQRAVNNRDTIQAKLDDPGTKPDERRRLEADLAEAKSQLHDLKTHSSERALDAEQAGISAEQGRGPAERVKALEKEIDLLERRRRLNNERNGGDPVVDAQLVSQAHALRTEKEDIEFAERQALETSRAQTAEMELQQAGHQAAAQILAVQTQYQERIAQALRDGKTELAQQLQMQQGMATEAARLAAYRRDPNGLRERAQKRADDRDRAAMHAKHDRDLSGARQRYEDDHRADLPADAAKRAAAIEKAVPDTWQPGVTAGDPQSKKPDGKDEGSAPVVSKLDEIKSLLHQNLTIP